MKVFKSGAKRSAQIKARYDLLCPRTLERFALRLGLGAAKYGENNWEKGLPFSDTFNHIIAHLYHYKSVRGTPAEKEDDDLAGVLCGIMFLMELGEQNKLLENEK